ncbi:MAG: YraN family protein [Deinococcales bacterium]
MNKQAPFERGLAAEALAARHLERAGLAILQHNFRIRGGEIDLIAKEGDVTVFIEVKQRSSSSHGLAGELISPRKAALVRHAALHYLGRDDLPCRFDAVLLEGKSQTITWIKDAF